MQQQIKEGQIQCLWLLCIVARAVPPCVFLPPCSMCVPPSLFCCFLEPSQPPRSDPAHNVCASGLYALPPCVFLPPCVLIPPCSMRAPPSRCFFFSSPRSAKDGPPSRQCLCISVHLACTSRFGALQLKFGLEARPPRAKASFMNFHGLSWFMICSMKLFILL